ncbi:CutA1 divalent ion tolerance protein [Pyrolobus fumarii 1A]|uniref:CutA1 divalent ion tolerance protein n=1 Tax=Pyrolobus fumarii (strain DSM 11204 / 1A) TaxID=694429 RepID=G0EHM4_PYRF1|nr:divalent-cation tolerance protein CutA [Pyrolobus fumarii]AEM39377.1 CutA1 divalent ion tolerance protein [Pyrolobus fumarii 1A]
MSVVVVFITAPKGKGEEIAGKIIESRLAACANVISGVKSVYWWKGKVERDEEDLIVLKTVEERLDELIEFVKRVHPYEVPEVIAVKVVKGLQEYLVWVENEVREA